MDRLFVLVLERRRKRLKPKKLGAYVGGHARLHNQQPGSMNTPAQQHHPFPNIVTVAF